MTPKMQLSADVMVSDTMRAELRYVGAGWFLLNHFCKTWEFGRKARASTELM